MAFGESFQAIIRSGLQDALSTMEGMVANEGQQTVYKEYVVEEFVQNAQADVDEGWSDVELPEYSDFMGEIIAEGNSIMEETYEYAQEVAAAVEAFL
jgi:hypothetical protein